MDLLGTYGSDEEDEDLPNASAAVAKTSSSSTFHSFLTALPPPKIPALQIDYWGEPVNKGGTLAQSVIGENGSSLSASLPGHRKVPLPSNFFDGPDVIHEKKVPDVRGKSGSLFMHLPPPSHVPSSTKSFLAKLPPPSNSKSKKNLVEFKPPVNLALLESSDEGDLERTKKRPKISEDSNKISEAKVGGLAALLPPPKNSLGAGVGFGGGLGAGGRRTAMETATSTVKEVTSINIPDKPRSSDNAEDNVVHSSMVERGSSEMRKGVNLSTHYHYSAQPGQGAAAPDTSYHGHESRISEGQFAQEQIDNGGGGYYVGGYQDETSWQYSGKGAYGFSSEPTPASRTVDPLAEVLKRERRKGKDEPPPQVIEVKQADLTGGRLREDQLRTTGIAFGPTYQPVSSNKDKPSKIHRRKHQIGALYFDMKQKEMELLDRRSRGNLTKAETQAKYGW